MSRWVLLLLVIYMTLGLSRMAPAKATRVALVITTMVVGIVIVRTAAHG